MTFDIDLLVRRREAEKWRTLVESLGFECSTQQENFLQFTGSERAGSWPLDLMLVNDQTFEKMWDQSQEIRYETVLLRLPSVEHLIALKLHALRQNLLHRTIKDFQDVVGLVAANQIDLRSPAMRDIFERYGTPELYRKLKIACDQMDENRAD